jgi:hypothetical protein
LPYGGGGKGYGISAEYTSGQCLIENNIFKHLSHSMLVQSGAKAMYSGIITHCSRLNLKVLQTIYLVILFCMEIMGMPIYLKGT